MDCTQFESQISEIDALSTTIPKELEGHAESCSSCREMLASHMRMLESLDRIMPIQPRFDSFSELTRFRSRPKRARTMGAMAAAVGITAWVVYAAVPRSEPNPTSTLASVMDSGSMVDVHQALSLADAGGDPNRVMALMAARDRQRAAP